MKYKKLLRPSFIFFWAYMLQFVLWYFFMPEYSVVFGVSDKFYSNKAIVKYIIYIVIFLLGILFGNLICLKKNIYSKNIKNNFFNLHSANLCFWVFIFSEVIYFLPIITSFKYALSKSFISGFSAIYYILEKDGRSIFSVLINIFPYTLIIYFYILFDYGVDIKIKSKIKNRTIILTLIIILHSVIAAKRMYFVYLIVIMLIVFSIIKREKKISKRVLVVGIISIGIIFISEIFRYGINISNKLGVNLISMDIFKLTYKYLSNAYIFSDVNNAMVILSEDSPTALVATASPFFRNIASNIFEMNLYNYAQIDNWTSSFGTVNYFALLWFDWSYFSFIIVFLNGILIQYYYLKCISNDFKMSMHTMIYILLMTGMVANLRINFFAQTIFILPILIIILTKNKN